MNIEKEILVEFFLIPLLVSEIRAGKSEVTTIITICRFIVKNIQQVTERVCKWEMVINRREETQ